MVRSFAVAVSVALWTAVLFHGGAARATTYSDYELHVIERELRRSGGTLDPEPGGKRVSRIEIVRLDVFDETDPVPDFVNVFHATTREAVIRRELLFGEGEEFDVHRADETARNLRLLRQLSLVLIVPVNDGNPNEVRVLVITKDVWSLRLNSDFEIANHSLNYLLLNPSEENLFGTHASVGALFVLLPHTYSAGLVLVHRRLFGSPFSAVAAFSRTFDRETGEGQGSYGRFLYGLPLSSVEQRWAFETGVIWSDQLARASVRRAGGSGFRLFTYDAERYVGGTEVIRSFGRRDKFDLSFGVLADRRHYRPHVPAGADPSEVRRFLEEVPVSDTRISPYVQIESYQNEFLKTIELETLGLQEDYRLGPETLLRLYPASTHLGSTRDFLGVLAGLSYTMPLGDGLIRGIASSAVEYARAQKHQTLLEFSLRVASPRLGLGRFVFDTVLADRGFNYLNRRYAIGGDDRLRGYPSGDIDLDGGDDQRGADAFVANTEFRTRGVNILSAQCGLAVFHDMGDAADRFEEIKLKHSVGLGVRILFPQVNRYVFRADWGLPLSAGYEPLPGGFFFTFEQAFPLRALGAPDLESTFLQ